MIQANPYKNVLFLAPTTVKKNTIIGEEVNEDMIRVAVRQAQDIDLQKIIGSCLMRRLQELIQEDEIGLEANAPYKVLLDEYIIPYMEALVVSNIAFDLSYKYRNKGVITTGDDRINNVLYDDVARLTQKHKVNAEAYKDYLCKFLETNGSDYPELTCGDCSNALETKDTKRTAPVPFYLG